MLSAAAWHDSLSDIALAHTAVEQLRLRGIHAFESTGGPPAPGGPLVVAGGEVLSPSHVDRFLPRGDHILSAVGIRPWAEERLD